MPSHATPRLGRRSVLALAAGLPALAAASPRTVGEALRDIAAARGLCFGSEVLATEIGNDHAYRDLVAAQCGILTPGYEAKWDHVEPQPGNFTFAPLDATVAFADAHRMRVRMHTLIWALAMPPWLHDALRDGDAAQARALLARHISVVCGRYAGRVSAWDVANELSDPLWHRGPEGLTLSPWRRALGPDLVPIAFDLARAADPGATLFLNEDGLEYRGRCFDEKRDTYRRLLDAWLARRVPIGGFGLQTHLSPQFEIDQAAYRAFLADLASRGLEIHLTELDIRDRDLPASPAIRDRIAADLAGRVLEAALDEPAVTTVVTWGLSDRYSYQSTDPEFRRPDGLPTRSLPYDAELAPTRLRDTIARTLAAAPFRTPRPERPA